MWIVSALNLPPEKYNHVCNWPVHPLRNYYIRIRATIRWIKKKNQDTPHLHGQQFNNTVMKCTLGFEDQCSYEQQSKGFQSWSSACLSTSLAASLTLECPSLLVCSSCHCSGDWKLGTTAEEGNFYMVVRPKAVFSTPSSTPCSSRLLLTRMGCWSHSLPSGPQSLFWVLL